MDENYRSGNYYNESTLSRPSYQNKFQYFWEAVKTAFYLFKNSKTETYRSNEEYEAVSPLVSQMLRSIRKNNYIQQINNVFIVIFELFPF